MKIEIGCLQCQSVLRVEDEHRGKQLRCPVCKHLNPIPGNPAGAEAAPNPPERAASPEYSPINASFDSGPTSRSRSSELSTSIILGIIGIVMNASCGGCLFSILFWVNLYGLIIAFNATGSSRQAAMILNGIALAMSGFWLLLMMLS